MSEPDALSLELERAIETAIGPVAKSVAEESFSPENRLQTVESHLKRAQEDIRASIASYKAKCAEGLRYLLEAAAEDPEIKLDQLREELEAGFSKLNSLQAIEAMSQEVANGATWKKALGFQESTLNTLYRSAHALFDSAKYVEAEAAFLLLASLDAAQSAFWLGLGHAKFYLNYFDEAVVAYEAAASLDPSSCWPEIYAASCHEAKGDFVKAVECLERAQAIFAESGEKEPELEEALRERCAYLKTRA